MLATSHRSVGRAATATTMTRNRPGLSRPWKLVCWARTTTTAASPWWCACRFSSTANAGSPGRCGSGPAAGPGSARTPPAHANELVGQQPHPAARRRCAARLWPSAAPSRGRRLHSRQPPRVPPPVRAARQPRPESAPQSEVRRSHCAAPRPAPRVAITTTVGCILPTWVCTGWSSCCWTIVSSWTSPSRYTCSATTARVATGSRWPAAAAARCAPPPGWCCAEASLDALTTADTVVVPGYDQVLCPPPEAVLRACGQQPRGAHGCCRSVPEPSPWPTPGCWTAAVPPPTGLPQHSWPTGSPR